MTSIKEDMYIISHGEAIGNRIFTLVLERLNVRSFQNFRHCDIRKLVHDKMNVNRESAAVNIVSGVIELLEKLGVEHADDEIEGAVIVGDDGKDGGLALAHLGQLQLVVLGDGGQGLQVELGQPGDQGDLDGLQGFAAAGMVVLVVFQRDMLGVAVLQTAEQNI